MFYVYQHFIKKTFINWLLFPFYVSYKYFLAHYLSFVGVEYNEYQTVNVY